MGVKVAIIRRRNIGMISSLGKWKFKSRGRIEDGVRRKGEKVIIARREWLKRGGKVRGEAKRQN